jgi:hemolysin activation/secretion protein
VQIAPFFDAGGGWNNDRHTPSPSEIYSLGTGLIWRPSALVSAHLYYGEPLTPVETHGNGGLQDAGVYFNVQVGFE